MKGFGQGYMETERVRGLSLGGTWRHRMDCKVYLQGFISGWFNQDALIYIIYIFNETSLQASSQSFHESEILINHYSRVSKI